MLRFLLSASLSLAVPGHAEFACPAGTAVLERKDNVQWMKTCRDAEGRLHGPFEVWTRPPADQGPDQAHRKTVEGRYARGAQTGTWTYWNIEGEKVSEKTFP